MRVEWLVNLGAYCSNAGPFISTGASPTSMAVNTYKTPAFYGLNRLVFTNTTPTTAYRGAGRPSVSYLVERLVDEAARVTGIDRIKLQAAQPAAEESLPVQDADRIHLRQRRSAWPVAAGLGRRTGAASSGAAARPSGAASCAAPSCATFIEPSGGGGQEEVALRFDASGALRLYALAEPVRPRSRNGVSDLVAEILGMAPDDVTLRYNDPAAPALAGMGSFGSRSLISHGSALSAGAHEVQHKGWNWRRRRSRSRPVI